MSYTDILEEVVADMEAEEDDVEEEWDEETRLAMVDPFNLRDDDDYWRMLSPEEYLYEWSRIYGDPLSHPAGPVPVHLLRGDYTHAHLALITIAHYSNRDNNIRPPVSLQPHGAALRRALEEDPEDYFSALAEVQDALRIPCRQAYERHM